MQASWVMGSNGRPSDDQALPCTEWAWAAATTSGRAWCTAEWMTNAARLTGRRPCTTSPWWLTRIRSDTLMWRKFMPKGLTQKWSVSSGSRAVMWPATPSENPSLPKMRRAPARRCLRCSRSSARVPNVGGMGNSIVSAFATKGESSTWAMSRVYDRLAARGGGPSGSDGSGEGVEQPLRGVLGTDLVPDAGKLPLLVHQEGGADDAHELPPVHRPLAPGAVRFGDGMVGVRQQGKAEPVLGVEPGLLVRRVRADPDDGRVPYLAEDVA